MYVIAASMRPIRPGFAIDFLRLVVSNRALPHIRATS
jgi:hypothetical protein